MEDYSFDLSRIILGNLPALFYVEIALRTTLLYLYTLAIFRILSERTSGGLTAFGVLIIVALGSAVGDPMFYPDVPILHGFLVITLVVSDGAFNLDGLHYTGISRREIFQMARQAGYRNLGEIQRMYITPEEEFPRLVL